MSRGGEHLFHVAHVVCLVGDVRADEAEAASFEEGGCDAGGVADAFERLVVVAEAHVAVGLDEEALGVERGLLEHFESLFVVWSCRNSESVFSCSTA